MYSFIFRPAPSGRHACDLHILLWNDWLDRANFSFDRPDLYIVRWKIQDISQRITTYHIRMLLQKFLVVDWIDQFGK